MVVTDNTNDNRAAFLALAKTAGGTKVEAQFEADGQFNDAVIIGSTTIHPLLIRTANANRIYVSTTGNVGIGTITPTFRLQMGTNSAAKPTSNAWTVISDARLKKDIRPFTDGLSLIDQINPIWFTYTGSGGMPLETGVGTLAQEFQKIAPYMVTDWTYTDPESHIEKRPTSY